MEKREIIEGIIVIALYVIRQIDLKRIKKGKRPILNRTDVVKVNKDSTNRI